MRWVVVTSIAGALLLMSGTEAPAKKVPCKDIRSAIAAGKTPEQVAKDLGAKPRRVEVCMTRGKKAGRKQAGAGEQAGAAAQVSPTPGAPAE